MLARPEAVTKAPGTGAHVWRGLDDLAAVSDAALVAFMLVVLALLPPVSAWVRAWPGLWCAAPLGLLAALGDRCEVRVDGARLCLTLYRAWLPVKHRRYGLGVEIALYQSWNAERPEGLAPERVFAPPTAGASGDGLHRVDAEGHLATKG